MDTVTRIVRRDLVEMASELTTIRSRLESLQDTLIPYLPEPPRNDEEGPALDPDPVVELHSLIGCFLEDSLKPLVNAVVALSEGQVGTLLEEERGKETG